MYKINEFAKLSGVSTRTLRYYHQIGLLFPEEVDVNGYRIYGLRQIDKLQQILLYREMGMPLEEIKAIMSMPHYNKEKALESHLIALMHKKERIELLIQNVTKTIDSLTGEDIMTEAEKFEGFKKELLDNNEALYGEEIREKYGHEKVDSSNAKVKGISQEQWDRAQQLSVKIHEMLDKAYQQGDPAGELAQEMCALHKQWLCMFWPQDHYTKEAHIGLAQLYVSDERFTAYYDEKAEGATEFLRDAINIYCKKAEGTI